MNAINQVSSPVLTSAGSSFGQTGVAIAAGLLITGLVLSRIGSASSQKPLSSCNSQPATPIKASSSWPCLNPITGVTKLVSSLASLLLSPARSLWSCLHGGESNHTGAGVLPYCIKNNEVYFLLSKEGYGSDKNTWCDFGGARDPGESAVQTAAREAWEESRGIMGNQKQIEMAISSAPSIGSRSYRMFLMQVDNPSSITNSGFVKKKFSNHCQMEKTAVAWVKASEVFKAVHKDNKISTGRFSFFKSDDLRRFFAKTVRNALQNPNQKKALEGIGKASPLKQAS